jgi:hypothetical protein
MDTFPEGKYDCKTTWPSRAQKIWIAERIANGFETFATISEKLKLTQNYVRQIVIKYRTGRGISVGNGRPRAIDDEGLQYLTNIAASRENITRKEALQLLNEVYLSSFKRRRPIKYKQLEDAGKLPKCPKATRRRYYDVLPPNIAAAIKGPDEIAEENSIHHLQNS